MRIDVTAPDISERGRCGWNCPIARGIQRAEGVAEDSVWVSDGWVEIDYGSGRWRTTERYKLPAKARRWLREYSHNGCTGKPFEFELELVTEAARSG